MATVTVYTAARMLAIENGAIVDGDVVGDNLILTKKDGTPIDAGNVRGPQGTTGNTGSAGADAAFRVRVATTANITLSGTQTVDGIALAVGDRVLCRLQTNPTQNGIWVVASGAWTRATDADTAAKIAGSMVLVQQGGSEGGTRWVTTFQSSSVIGTNNMFWYRNIDGFNMAIVQPAAANTDANGFITINHGLSWTPSLVLAMNGTPSANFAVLWGVDTITATTFRARFFNASTAGPANVISTGSQRYLCFR